MQMKWNTCDHRSLHHLIYSIHSSSHAGNGTISKFIVPLLFDIKAIWLLLCESGHSKRVCVCVCCLFISLYNAHEYYYKEVDFQIWNPLFLARRNKMKWHVYLNWRVRFPSTSNREMQPKQRNRDTEKKRQRCERFSSYTTKLVSFECMVSWKLGVSYIRIP